MGTYQQGISSQGSPNQSLSDIVMAALVAAGYTEGSLADRTMAFFRDTTGGGTSMVAMMVSDPVAPVAQDVLLRDAVIDAGYGVELLASTGACPNTGYLGVIVTESGTAGSVANTSVDSCLLPVIHMETNWDTTGFASVGASAPGSINTIDIKAAHPITAGLPDPMTYRNFNNTLYGVPLANLAPGAVAIADHGAFPNHVVIAAIEAGGAYAAGTVPATAPARRVTSGLGVTSSIVAQWTADAYTLWDQMLQWTFGAPAVGGGAYSTIAEYFRYHLGIKPDPLIDPSELV
jgi:hypothetical protein